MTLTAPRRPFPWLDYLLVLLALQLAEIALGWTRMQSFTLSEFALVYAHKALIILPVGLALHFYPPEP